MLPVRNKPNPRRVRGCHTPSKSNLKLYKPNALEFLRGADMAPTPLLPQCFQTLFAGGTGACALVHVHPTIRLKEHVFQSLGKAFLVVREADA